MHKIAALIVVPWIEKQTGRLYVSIGGGEFGDCLSDLIERCLPIRLLQCSECETEQDIPAFRKCCSTDAIDCGPCLVEEIGGYLAQPCDVAINMEGPIRKSCKPLFQPFGMTSNQDVLISCFAGGRQQRIAQ